MKQTLNFFGKYLFRKFNKTKLPSKNAFNRDLFGFGGNRIWRTNFSFEFTSRALTWPLTLGRRITWVYVSHTVRSSHLRCSVKIGVLKNFVRFTGKHLCQNLFFNKVKKKVLAQVFSSEFCEFFIEHLWATASERCLSCLGFESFSVLLRSWNLD